MERLRGWWPRLKPFVLIAVGFVVAWFAIRLIGSIDWGQVWSAVTQLSWYHVVPLLLALALRQGFNAVPLAKFVPELRYGQSVQNDLSAVVVGTLSPPPADVVLRVAQFKSWGVNPVDGMAGVTLNMLTFYAVRFLAPAIGLIALAFAEIESHHWTTAGTSAIVALVVILGLVMLARESPRTAIIGRAAGRVAQRFKDDVDPEQWGQNVSDFQGRMAGTLKVGLTPALAALVGMVLADGLIVYLSLRFVGVGTQMLSMADIFGTFLIAYPLTLLPLFGTGPMDAAMLAAWVGMAGHEVEAPAFAALIIWRVVTLLGPLALGFGAIAWWKRTTGQSVPQQTS